MEIAYSHLAPKDCTTDWTLIADPAELARYSDYLFVTLAASEATRKATGKLMPDNMSAHLAGRPLLTPVL